MNPLAVGIAMFFQRGHYPQFNCPWCKDPVSPVSRSQATCEKLGCSEKQQKASRAKSRAARGAR